MQELNKYDERENNGVLTHEQLSGWNKEEGDENEIMETKNVDEAINEQKTVLKLRQEQLKNAEKSLATLEQLKNDLLTTRDAEKINKYVKERLDAIDSASDLVDDLRNNIANIQAELERLINYKKTIYDVQKKF